MVFYVYQYLVEQLLHLLVAYFPQTAHWSSEDGITGNVVDDEHPLSSAGGGVGGGLLCSLIFSI